jgi:hypothetical protein
MIEPEVGASKSQLSASILPISSSQSGILTLALDELFETIRERERIE